MSEQAPEDLSIFGVVDESPLLPEKVELTTAERLFYEVEQLQEAPQGDTLDTLIKLSSAFLEVGQFAYPQVATSLKTIVALGKLITAISSSMPKPDDPVMAKLKELETKVTTLGDKMNAKFADLKAFMTEIKFDEQIMQPIFKLMEYFTDCLHHPSKEASANFLEAYIKNKPLDMTYTVLGQMRLDATNPLKMAMAADVLKTSTTFEKWEKIISGVLGQFAFLEGYAHGLRDGEVTYDLERLKEKSQKLVDEMKVWREDYTKKSDYWPGLKTYLGQYLDETCGFSNEQRVYKLKELLLTALTNDTLFITVFDKEATHFNYGLGVFVDDQVIDSQKRGGCNVIIYRCKEGKLKNVGYTNSVISGAREVWNNNSLVPATHDYSDTPKCLKKYTIKEAGMICLISVGLHPASAITNLDPRLSGPVIGSDIISSKNRWYDSIKLRFYVAAV